MAGDFFDTYADGGPDGGAFIGKLEKDELIAARTPLTVTRITRGTTKFGEQYFVHVLVEGEEEDRVLGFKTGQVESRDRKLDAMQEWLLVEENDLPVVRIVNVPTQSGNSFKDIVAVDAE